MPGIPFYFSLSLLRYCGAHGSGRSLPACPYSRIPLYARCSVATPVLWNNLDDCTYRGTDAFYDKIVSSFDNVITRSLSSLSLGMENICMLPQQEITDVRNAMYTKQYISYLIT